MRILLIDDHPIFTQGLKLLLSELDERIQCVMARSLREALEMSGAFDLILLDLHMPETDGLDGLKQIYQAFADVPVVILSSDEDSKVIRQMIVNGASGFIPKSSTPPVLIAALRLILNGGTYLPPQGFEFALECIEEAMPLIVSSKPKIGLSQRQLEVLLKLTECKSNKIIARELDLSEGTVKTHVSTVFRVLNVNSRAEVVSKAMQMGFILSSK